jgi:biofilm PGA synthesis N-glycosyltransferase PgaC
MGAFMPILLTGFFLALVLYIMAGYPLLLAFRACRSSRPVLKKSHPQPVSIIIAVHNGEDFLATKLDSILHSDYPRELMEIIVVSDGSTDSTDSIASQYAKQGVRLLRIPRAGKPAALNAGAQAASAGLLIFTDVRQTFDSTSIPELVSCFADPAVGVASGYLVIRSGDIEERNVGLYWRYERWIRGNLSRIDSTLGTTGAFYGIRRHLFRPMPPETLLDDVWVPMGAFFAGYRIIIDEQARMYDEPTGVNTEFRRKVRTLAGNWQLLGQYPELLTTRNRLLFDFLSYKFARLTLPWIFLGILISSFFLPAPWRVFALAPQVVFYGLSALDFVTGPRSPLKRLSSPARTVVSMLAASACAVSILFLPADRFWKTARTAAASK